jgi:hypothetical protein
MNFVFVAFFFGSGGTGFCVEKKGSERPERAKTLVLIAVYESRHIRGESKQVENWEYDSLRP